MIVDSPVVVVPDGLAAPTAWGPALPAPSFVFRAVLDHIARNHSERRVYIAPANHFGAGVHEHIVALDYLAQRGVRDVVAIESKIGNRYVDTWGNAVQLRRQLEAREAWPLSPVVLVVAKRHAKRAHLCFQRAGFSIAKLDDVDYQIPNNEHVVWRLCYYRHPRIHRLYEFVAALRDRWRLRNAVI